MRILISRLSSLGDVVCSLPVAVAAKKQWPECEITWAVSPAFAPIVRSSPSVDKVIEVKPGFSPATWPKFNEPFDLALDLQGLLKSAIVVAKAKAKEKLGYHWQREGASLFSSRVLPDPTSFHIVDQYVDVIRAAGAEVSRAEWDLKPDEQALTTVQDLIRYPLYVVMNPGAAWVTKRWPPEHFSALIDRAPIPVVLIGTKQEAEANESIAAACKDKPLNIAGKTNLSELIAVIANCAAHVGGDTGSTHLAAALGKPAVGLYSLTNPRRSCPYGQITHCLYNPSGLQHITVSQVHRVLEGVLS
ncbi:MAG: glycosyltransferase family 9 protein [Armatimonadetes bacterium]|nr:glycosyltransferase family 9 protein [Armatimonadota bacterium]